MAQTFNMPTALPGLTPSSALSGGEDAPQSMAKMTPQQRAQYLAKRKKAPIDAPPTVLS